jgi:hypothetical protein
MTLNNICSSETQVPKYDLDLRFQENNKYVQRSRALTTAYLFENSNLLLISHDLDFHAITMQIVEEQLGSRASLAHYPACCGFKESNYEFSTENST